MIEEKHHQQRLELHPKSRKMRCEGVLTRERLQLVGALARLAAPWRSARTSARTSVAPRRPGALKKLNRTYASRPKTENGKYGKIRKTENGKYGKYVIREIRKKEIRKIRKT